MKTGKHFWIIAIALMAFCAGEAMAKSLGVQMREGVYKEEMEGDLDAAIEIYQGVADSAKENHRYAAQATYRIGLCLLKKGEKDKAAEHFQKVVADFANERRVVSMAKKELAKIGPPAGGDTPVNAMANNPQASPQATVEAFLKAVLSKSHPESRKAKFYIDAGSAIIHQLKDFPELVKDQKLTVESVYLDGTGAMVFTSQLNTESSRSPVPSGQLEFTLEKQRGLWFITDIDFEDAEGAKDDLKRFLKYHPSAKEIDIASASDQPDSSSLQSLIDNAEAGSTVVVPDGVYTEPIRINKPLTLKGQSRDGCVFEVTANEPAIMIDTMGKGLVNIKDLTIKWQLATSDKNIEYPMAIAVKDASAGIRNCVFRPLGNAQRSPIAIRSSGFANMNIYDSDFEGFDYVICYGEGNNGSVVGCYIANCGHQGVICYTGAKLTLSMNIITGSKYHAVRNTGGQLKMTTNLIINNANRGIYLGNKSGRGEIWNNLIVGNGTAIGCFARATYKITNNLIMNNSYSGISMEKSCWLDIKYNILMSNERGLVMFDRGEQGDILTGYNTFWNNKANAENFTLPDNSKIEEPQFRDAAKGDFSIMADSENKDKHGLRDSKLIWQLWQKWQQRKIGLKTSEKKSPTVTQADKNKAEGISSKGWKLWGQRKLEEAEVEFKKAVALDPTYPHAWNGLGWSQFNQGKPSNAKTSFEKCIAIEPKHAGALNGLGWVAKGQGNVEDAIAYWETAIKAAPTATAALNGITQAYMEQEQYDKAGRYYKMWLKAEPNNADAKAGLEKVKAALN